MKFFLAYFERLRSACKSENNGGAVGQPANTMNTNEVCSRVLFRGRSTRNIKRIFIDQGFINPGKHLHFTRNNGDVFDFREIDVKTSLESRVGLNESGLINGKHFSSQAERELCAFQRRHCDEPANSRSVIINCNSIVEMLAPTLFTDGFADVLTVRSFGRLVII